MKKLLIQTQLSNYDTQGKFILECDSGYNMMMGRTRVLLQQVPDLKVFITGPQLNQCRTSPYDLNADLFNDFGNRLKYIPLLLIPNALATRYDFVFEDIARALDLGEDGHEPFTHVFINDPMLLRNFQALFFLKGKYRPKYIVHSHFIDNPECPKFPTEASLWMGQMEAAFKADFNFWQCESSLQVFLKSAMNWLCEDLVAVIRHKSLPWDDGYSSEEINSPINMNNVRFDVNDLARKTVGKTVVFVPNRIGGFGRSSDYTNCGRFMFETVPRVRKMRDDFVVIAGNPSQKILNHELEELCPAFLNLVPDALNRDEYKYVARHIQDISVGLYNQDSYGGTAARELCDVGTIPLWVDNYEYTQIALLAGLPKDMMIAPDLSNMDETLVFMLDWISQVKHDAPEEIKGWHDRLSDVVYRRCSYEATSDEAIRHMGL